jgi:hypothetical protein
MTPQSLRIVACRYLVPQWPRRFYESAASSFCAQGQHQNVAKLKTDARNDVGIIGADKDKTQAYCQTLDLARQLERADQEKDRKKAGVLSQKIIQLQKLVGPEFFTLANIVKHLDLNSPDGREIASIIQSLNQSCHRQHGRGRELLPIRRTLFQIDAQGLRTGVRDHAVMATCGQGAGGDQFRSVGRRTFGKS